MKKKYQILIYIIFRPIFDIYKYHKDRSSSLFFVEFDSNSFGGSFYSQFEGSAENYHIIQILL